ncbi:venom metalloproteinase antarease-like TtrivMP_A [Ixodes scapularis]|uniref:venom metalloproteinase antarease-like TtrivMP_A n=1 Tax=Ixodes scapularis TaxID=6945 RepID=UPI001C3823A1|nr:venom metalloproteinase antarease-like TtrivMP_A [Ixodes scapularis]
MYSATLIIFSVATAHADVVYPVLIESRSGNSRGAVQLSKDYVIDLEESSVLGDSLYFSEAKYGEVNHELMDTTDIRKSVYENSKHKASFTITETDVGIEMEGYLNFTHGIEPLRIHKKSGRVPHRIYPLPTPEEAIHLEIPVEERSDGSLLPKNDAAEPPTVWRPEMYVMIDSVIHKALKESKLIQAQYIIRLMNIVNAIFKTVRKPRINLQLVGIFRFPTKEDEYFIVEEDNIVSAYESIEAFGQFTENTTFKRPADFYLMLVGRRLGMRNEKTKKLSPKGYGISFFAMVCVKGANVAISEEEPAVYYSFTTIAHEIGHLLGSMHDGSGPLGYPPNHPGAVACKLPEKYIMKPRGPHGPPFAFSYCSEVQMQFVLKLRGEECWKTQSDYDFFTVTKEVAGHLITPETFCRRINPEQYSSASMKNCVITCRNNVPTKNGYFQIKENTHFAPFGYPCGNNGERCWFGNCTNIDSEVS